MKTTYAIEIETVAPTEFKITMTRTTTQTREHGAIIRDHSQYFFTSTKRISGLISVAMLIDDLEYAATGHAGVPL